MTKSQRHLQKDAFYALYTNNLDDLDRLLNEGARMDLDRHAQQFGRYGDENKPIYTLEEKAVRRFMEYDLGEEAVRLLESRGANINELIERVASPKNIEIFENKKNNFFKFLLDRWESFFEKKHGKWEDLFTMTRMAASNNEEKIIFLLDKGVDVDSRDENGRTALMYARNKNITRLLLDNGADIKAVDLGGKTPIWHAAKLMIRKIKVVKDRLTVADESAEPLIELCQNNGLVNDRCAIAVGRLLGPRFDRFLYGVHPNNALNLQSLDDIARQVQQARHLDIKMRLSKNMKRTSERSKETPSDKSPKM